MCRFHCLTDGPRDARVTRLGWSGAPFHVPERERSSALNDVVSHCFKSRSDGCDLWSRELDLLSRRSRLREPGLGGPRLGRHVSLRETILNLEPRETFSSVNHRMLGTRAALLREGHEIVWYDAIRAKTICLGKLFQPSQHLLCRNNRLSSQRLEVNFRLFTIR